MARSVQQIAADAHNELIHDENNDEGFALDMGNIIDTLSQAYNNQDHVEITFDKPRYQAAYMYMYFSSLCHSVKYGLDLFDLELGEWNILPNHEPLELNVCSIGGGPGTDVLGFCRYMQRFLEDKNVHRELVLNATIIDKYYEWEDAWNAIENQNQEDVAPINLNGYIGYDIRKPAGRFAKTYVSNANVILMFKFVSAVKGLPAFEENLTDLLRNAPVGSYLIYGDNSGGGFTALFRRIAQGSGFINVKRDDWGNQREGFQNGEIQHQAFRVPDGGELNVLDERYGRNHQNNLAMCFMLLKKPLV